MVDDLKNIHWLVPFKADNSHEVLNSNLASIRLRSGLFTLPFFNDHNVTFSENIYGIDEIECLFISKFAGNREDLLNTWIEIINFHRDNGKKIIFDYTDHHHH